MKASSFWMVTQDFSTVKVNRQSQRVAMPEMGLRRPSGLPITLAYGINPASLYGSNSQT
jgi:hypothetical protein